MIFENLDELFNYFELVHNIHPHNFFIKLDNDSIDRYHVHIINEVADGNLVVGEQIAEVLLLEDLGVELLWSSLFPINPEYVVYRIYECTKTKTLHGMLFEMMNGSDELLSQFYWESSDGAYQTYLWVADTYIKFAEFTRNK